MLHIQPIIYGTGGTQMIVQYKDDMGNIKHHFVDTRSEFRHSWCNVSFESLYARGKVKSVICVFKRKLETP
jgi:hypothetical protein